ncbi:MAG: PAS domain S-box protein [Desulfuromonadaceae bacterium]|nr:PAS domain S-box protein [Desulfuromonadaceae bacterium]
MNVFKQAIIAVVLASIIGFLTYTAVSQYVVHKAEENLRNIMLSHRSFHAYIQQVMHPTYYKARDAGKIAEDFYAPEILSSSYVIRVMHGFFNEERKRSGLSEVYYKLAANNPRNPVNKADGKEAALISLFNNNRDLKEYTEIATIDGKKYLVYAKPFLETNQACIRCHGKRKDAPPGLQHIYSGQGGFNETAGVIRAIESVRLPLNDEFKTTFIVTTVSLSVAVILIILYSFNARLRLKVDQSTSELKKEIEERKLAEEALKFTRISFDAASDAMYWVNPEGCIVDVNEASCRALGYSREELLRMTVADVDPGTTNEVWQQNFSELRTHRTLRFESSHRAHDGRIFPVEIVANYVRHGDEELNCGFVRDISARKQMEDELHNRDETFSQFMHHSPIYVYIKEVTPAGSRVLQASDNFDEMVGIPGSAMTGKMTAELFPAEFAAKIDAEDRAVVTKGEVHKIDEDFNGRNYTTIKFPLVQGERILLAGYTIDITERRRTEAALMESEQRFRSLLEDIPSVAAQGYALDGTVLFWNRASEQMYGYTPEEALGANLLDLIIPEEMKAGVTGAIQKMAESGEAIPAGELLLKRKDGSRVPVFSSHALLTPIGGQPELFCLDIDLTERKCAEEQRIKLEQQLRHAQKLESLGVLAGGIAHDFNNILMAIMGNADLALMRINRESPAVENLHRIEQASARAADLAKQMLAYSGKGKFVVENIDINTLLEDMLHMLEVSISKKAVLRINKYSPLPTIDADATQMRQIIMNLVINASEAIGDKSGVIAISTGCIDCNRGYLKDVWLDESLDEGLYVYLEIADTGCGMDNDTLAKLFDPFFTTKFTGRGLGMAAVLGIVRGHKGAIKVYSELKRGTTFKILLPASERPAEVSNGTGFQSDWKGAGNVLLVDDEEAVLGIGTEMLKELGFNVITAEDGRDAVEKFTVTPDIDFVILDLTMPHMDGEQCFRELRRLRSDIKVIMSSGFNEQEVTQKFAGKGLAGFIQKPYKLSVLREAIQKI